MTCCKFSPSDQMTDMRTKHSSRSSRFSSQSRAMHSAITQNVGSLFSVALISELILCLVVVPVISIISLITLIILA